MIIGGSTTATGTLPEIVHSGLRNAAATGIKIRNNNVSGTRFTCGILAIGVNGGPFNAVAGLMIDSNTIHASVTPVKSASGRLLNQGDRHQQHAERHAVRYIQLPVLRTSIGNTFAGLLWRSRTMLVNRLGSRMAYW